MAISHVLKQSEVQDGQSVIFQKNGKKDEYFKRNNIMQPMTTDDRGNELKIFHIIQIPI